jgi:hypothetical protein
MVTRITIICFTIAAGLLISCVPSSRIRQLLRGVGWLLRGVGWLLLVVILVALATVSLIWLSTASAGTQWLVMLLIVYLLI